MEKEWMWKEIQSSGMNWVRYTKRNAHIKQGQVSGRETNVEGKCASE
jgi:hypothetical protein